MVIVDEISFGGKKVIEKLNKNLRELKEEPSLKFGGLDIVFSGDFSQLEPVNQKSLFKDRSLIWDEWVHTYFELRTNHRFASDPDWGKRLERFCDVGHEPEDIKEINSKSDWFRRWTKRRGYTWRCLVRH